MLFRSANDCVKLTEWCKDDRKMLVLVDDGIKLDYYNPEDAKDAFAGAMSKVFLIFASVFAEIEGQRFVQRARDRVAYPRNTDRWGYGLPPYGFQIVDHPSGKGKALAHDPDAQQILHEAASRYLAGGSFTGIAADFNARGIPTSGDARRKRAGRSSRGELWTMESIKRILSNPSTQGIKTAKGKPVLDAHGEAVRVGPASFDAETWSRIQSELDQRSQNPRERRHSTNPLLGVAKCGVCGKNLRQRSQTTPAGKTHRYYNCGNSPKACPSVSIIAADAEELVEQALLHVHADRRVKALVWQDGSDHSAELDQTNRTVASLREDRAMGSFTTPEDEQMYREQMKALTAKRDKLAALPIVRAGWVEIETAQTYSDAWPTASVEERRTMLTDAGVVLRVTRPNHVELYTDFALLLGEGPSALEVIDAEERRAAAERKRWDIPESGQWSSAPDRELVRG